MTREDAIYWIKNLAVLATEKDMTQIEEALNMAIEALADRKTEPIDKDINVRSKTEPQTEVDWKQRLCDMYGADRKSFDEAWEKYEADKVEGEPQTEKPKIRKRIDKPFRAVWLDDDHNEIGTPQTERSE